MTITLTPLVAPIVLSFVLLASSTVHTPRPIHQVTPFGDVLVSERLDPRAYTGSGTYRMFVPPLAFDGEEVEAYQYWNAGDLAPQWVEVDLGRTEGVTRLRLVVAMLPDGDATHEVWVSNQPIQEDLSAATKLHIFQGPMTDRQVLELKLESPWAARYVQVRTIASPSWVAWMEVQVFAAPAL
ncbi:MAG: hypothetical protein FD129_1388 [bacterium]|nr:MAG: hypothetical protein FD129_1388 [bacterium]